MRSDRPQSTILRSPSRYLTIAALGLLAMGGCSTKPQGGKVDSAKSREHIVPAEPASYSLAKYRLRNSPAQTYSLLPGFFSRRDAVMFIERGESYTSIDELSGKLNRIVWNCDVIIDQASDLSGDRVQFLPIT